MAILAKKREKEIFLELLGEISKLLKIRIFAYCLMNTHYHLVFENTSGRMSDFFKQLNGQFATLYRKNNGGRGYVFQDRFHSILIQDDSYLMTVIAYILNNPVRAKLVRNFLDYKWSSGNAYFSNFSHAGIDTGFVEKIFGSQKKLEHFVNGMRLKDLPLVKTKIGTVIGDDKFFGKAVEKFERRSPKQSLDRKRSDDQHFQPVEKVFYEFKKKYRANPERIDTTTHAGKKLRAALLVYLKEKGGLRYRDIIKMDLFSDVKMSTLGSMYQRAKKNFKKG